MTMSSPTKSAMSSGGPTSVASSSARPVTPTKMASISFKSPKLSPRVPTSPIRYFCEEVRNNDGICPTLVITRGYRESTYFEDNCSADPEGDILKYTKKLEIIKKQVEVNKQLRDIERIYAQVQELREIFEPANAHLNDLLEVYNEAVAAHKSKFQMIQQITAASNVTNGTQEMTKASIIEARKAKAKVAKLELEAMESEIEVLEAQELVEAEKFALDTRFTDFKALQVTLEEKSIAVVALKDDLEQADIAWIAKYKAGETTSAISGGNHDALASLEHVHKENTRLQNKVMELSSEKAAAAEELRVLNQKAMALTAAEAKIQAQTQELVALNTFVERRKKDIEEMKKGAEAETKSVAKMKDVEAQLAAKVKALEAKIEIMKPIYRLGRSMRYRNNYSRLRTKYPDQNINISLDKYEDGHAAYFAGNVIADSTMYHAGFDDEDTFGRDVYNFETLHNGIQANMVWDHRNDFKILANILDMVSDMNVYIAKEDKTDDEFGSVEFKELFDKVLPRILPVPRGALAITSDEQFKKHDDLVVAFEEMVTIATNVAAKNYVERRKGVEKSWEQPWENAWMEHEDLVYEANRLGMF